MTAIADGDDGVVAGDEMAGDELTVVWRNGRE